MKPKLLKNPHPSYIRCSSHLHEFYIYEKLRFFFYRHHLGKCHSLLPLASINSHLRKSHLLIYKIKTKWEGGFWGGINAPNSDQYMENNTRTEPCQHVNLTPKRSGLGWVPIQTQPFAIPSQHTHTWVVLAPYSHIYPSRSVPTYMEIGVVSPLSLGPPLKSIWKF